MPFAHLMYASATRVDTPGLAAALTELIATRLRKQASLAALRIEPVSTAQWTIGAEPLEGSGLAAAHLNVLVTAGTNSAAEMADFIAAAHALLAHRLGALHPASYVAVQELPATAWGYAGRTQESRRLERAAVGPNAR